MNLPCVIRENDSQQCTLGEAEVTSFTKIQDCIVHYFVTLSVGIIKHANKGYLREKGLVWLTAVYIMVRKTW